MEQLIQTGENILKWMQMGGVVSAAIAVMIGGYFFMWGGQEGSRKSKPWIIGAIVGLILVLGARVIADSIGTNINF